MLTKTSHKGYLELYTPAIVSTLLGSDDIRMGKMVRLKNLLPNWSNQSIASFSIGVSTSVQMELFQAFHGVKEAALVSSLQPHDL